LLLGTVAKRETRSSKKLSPHRALAIANRQQEPAGPTIAYRIAAADAPSPPPKAAFHRNPGQRNTDFVDDLHRAMAFDWYVEIGCRGRRLGKGWSRIPIRKTQRCKTAMTAFRGNGLTRNCWITGWKDSTTGLKSLTQRILPLPTIRLSRLCVLIRRAL
jgi:hypothetical protein